MKEQSHGSCVLHQPTLHSHGVSTQPQPTVLLSGGLQPYVTLLTRGFLLKAREAADVQGGKAPPSLTMAHDQIRD